MFTTSMARLRDEPLTAWTTVVGVLLITVLLWAIGAVAQGQVERAHARPAEQVQALSLRCGPERSAACGALQAAAAAATDQTAGLERVPVAYR
jgi:hypothetical protein